MWWVIIGTAITFEVAFFVAMVVGGWLAHRNQVEVDDALF